MRRKGIYTKPVSRPQQAKRSARRGWRWWKNLSKPKKFLLIGGPILAFLIVVPLVTYAFYYSTITDQQKLMNANNTGVVLTDKNGKAFFTIGRAEHREIVNLNKVSKSVKEALIATEDKDFYKHKGFSVAGIFRAFYGNLLAGGVTGGGSTISQQLAKNLLLSQNQTILRKYQELTISIAIEQRYSKDEILAMYLSSVFFGGTNFGIDEAAKFYFNTTSDKLDLAQSSMLIGILPAPNAYSPTLGNAKYAKERQKTVLTRMVKEGYISQAEADAAYGQKLAYAEPRQQESSEAPHFAEMVMSELNKKYGEEKVLRSGYQVKTSLDLDMQKKLNANLQAHIPYIQLASGTNASGIAIDPKNGEIRALVGSADWNNDKWGKVNMATTPRQPGSSFKSIYYAGALANGTITPATILRDQPTDFGGGYRPQNADRNFRGDVTVRSAISQSLNIPSVEVLRKYGVNQTVDTAGQLGITTLDKNKNYGLSLALGAAEVPLNQMTNAYAAFANGGQQYPTTTITEVKDKFDQSIFSSQEKSKTTVSAQGAYLISDILSDNSARAPIFGNSLTVPGSKVAVKTGTTDDSRDAWTIGYTPKIALGVWVGNNDNAPMRSGGSDMAGPIWRTTMQQYLESSPNTSFPKPGGIVDRAVCYGTGSIADNSGSNTYNEVFASQYLPTGRCNSQKEVRKISVCRLNDKRMVEISEDDFDSSRYSRNAADCRKETETSQPEAQTMISVCNLTTKQIETIDEKDFDSAQYSRDLAQCSDTTPTDPENPTDPVTPPPNSVTPPRQQ